MGISNSIGSNVFDVLLCLGLPWFLKAALFPKVPNQHSVQINSQGLVYSSISLFSTLAVLYISLVVGKFKLTKSVGIACLIMYAIFLVFASILELNTFFVVNLPTCVDWHSASQTLANQFTTYPLVVLTGHFERIVLFTSNYDDNFYSWHVASHRWYARCNTRLKWPPLCTREQLFRLWIDFLKRARAHVRLCLCMYELRMYICMHECACVRMYVNKYVYIYIRRVEYF